MSISIAPKDREHRLHAIDRFMAMLAELKEQEHSLSFAIERGATLCDGGEGIVTSELNGTETWTLEINGGAFHHKVY